jgi:hypothetical protein
LVKVTTFGVFCLPCVFFILWFWTNTIDSRFSLKVISKFIFLTFMIFVVPIAISWIWFQFCDHQKSLNPLAFDLLSSNKAWYFGLPGQRGTADTWWQIFSNSHLINIFGSFNFGNAKFPIFLITGFLAALTSPRWRFVLMMLFICFSFPLLVFVNLYYVHDYYFYANNLFLSLFSGLTLLGLLERAGNRQLLLALLFVPSFFALTYMEFLRSYPYFVITNTNKLAQLVKENTNENEILLIYGFDWNPAIPYYAQRRTIMDRENLALNSPKMLKAIENLGNDKITAMFIQGKRDSNFINERVARFNLNPIPIGFGNYFLYLSNARLKTIHTP